MALADKGGSPNGGKATASGGGGSTSTSGSTTLSLSSETLQLNRNLPSWCLSEDAYDQRVFSGSLYGTSATSYRLCDLNTDGFNAGGIGVESDVWVVGQLSDLTITSPDGSVHHANLMSQTSAKGVTTYHYAVCYVPPYYLSTDIGTDPLMGGTWRRIILPSFVGDMPRSLARIAFSMSLSVVGSNGRMTIDCGSGVLIWASCLSCICEP